MKLELDVLLKSEGFKSIVLHQYLILKLIYLFTTSPFGKDYKKSRLMKVCLNHKDMYSNEKRINVVQIFEFLSTR